MQNCEKLGLKGNQSLWLCQHSVLVLDSVLKAKQTQVASGHCHGKGVVRLMTFQKGLQSCTELIEISICVSKKKKGP